MTNTIAPTNLVAKVTFDPQGHVVNATDARGNVISNSWSATGKLLSTTLPATAQGIPVIANTYDSRDNLIKTLDPLGQAATFAYDLNSRLISQADPLQRVTQFGFDANGRPTAVTNAAGEVTRQTWDKRGQLLRLTDGAGHFSTRAYDAAGNQVTLTNRNGKVWKFAFDGANRLTGTTTPLGRSATQSYNNRGLIATSKDMAGQVTSFNFDAKKRLTNRVDAAGSTLYSFDANNNPASVAENNQTNSWTYDAYNRVASYKDTYGNLIQYKYDPNGNLTNLIYPDGKIVTYAYDALNRMTNVTDWAGRKTTYTYDLASHLTGLTRPNGTTRTLAYDKAGQMTNIWEQTGAAGWPITLMRFGWNPATTMGWEFIAPLPHTNSPPTRTMTYDDDNRLASVNGMATTSDANGNLTYAPLANGAFATQTFDARNRLTSSGGFTNLYDAVNNRIGQRQGTNATLYVVNPNAALSQVLMRVKNDVTNWYVYGRGLLYEVEPDNSTRTYHFDSRGSTVAITDDSGNVTDRMEYSAYGLTTYRSGNTDTPFLFNGYYGVQTDGNGLLYMRARYYNPYLCRFINPDPSGFAGGLNWYAFAGGNPVSYVDPFGLCAMGDNQSTSWLSSTWSAITGTVSTGVQDVYNLLYTGQLNPPPEVYEAAIEAAGDYVYDSGGVRGFYGGTGLNGKQPGYGSIAGQVGLTGTWTMDSGYGAEIGVGVGLQERGQNSLGIFTSQTIGVGSAYQFWSQGTGLQAPSLGSDGNISMPSIYGGTANSQGGANFVIQNQNNAGIGINYGTVYGGLIINPTLVLRNFIDSYHIIAGTSSP